MLRALIFVAWVFGSVPLWWCVLFLFNPVITYLVNERQLHLPDGFYLFFNYGLVLGGTLLIPAIVAVLALRGKLPGTAHVK